MTSTDVAAYRLKLLYILIIQTGWRLHQRNVNLCAANQYYSSIGTGAFISETRGLNIKKGMHTLGNKKNLPGVHEGVYLALHPELSDKHKT